MSSKSNLFVPWVVLDYEYSSSDQIRVAERMRDRFCAQQEDKNKDILFFFNSGSRVVSVEDFGEMGGVRSSRSKIILVVLQIEDNPIVILIHQSRV